MMSRLFLVSISLGLALSSTAAQSQKPSSWTLMIDAGWQLAASDGMRATTDEAIADGGTDNILRRYPYATPDAALSFGMRLLHAVDPRIRLYGGLSSDVWTSSSTRVSGFTSYASASLRRYGLDLGGEADVLSVSPTINVVAGIGLQANIFEGSITTRAFAMDYVTSVQPAFRIGLRTDAGFQWRTHDDYSIRLVGGYSVGNLLGASFAAPQRNPNAFLPESDLNDGPNPGDPTDDGRTIASWTIRLGFGLAL